MPPRRSTRTSKKTETEEKNKQNEMEVELVVSSDEEEKKSKPKRKRQTKQKAPAAEKPAKRARTKKAEIPEEDSEEEVEEEVLPDDDDDEEQVTVLDPKINDDDETTFNRLEKLPTHIIAEIMLFLPAVPYYFSLQALSKGFLSLFQQTISEGSISHLHFMNIKHSEQLDKTMMNLVSSCKSRLRYLCLPPISYKCSDELANIRTLLGECPRLEKLVVPMCSPFVTIPSTLFPFMQNHFGFGMSLTPSTTQSVNTSLKCIRLMGIMHSKTNRRYGMMYTLNSSQLARLAEEFPNLETIEYSFCNLNRELEVEHFQQSKQSNNLKFQQSFDDTVNFGSITTVRQAQYAIDDLGISPRTLFRSPAMKEDVLINMMDMVILQPGSSSKKSWSERLNILLYLAKRAGSISFSSYTWYVMLSFKLKWYDDVLRQLCEVAKQTYKGKIIDRATLVEAIEYLLGKRQLPRRTTVDESIVRRRIKLMIESGWDATADDFLTDCFNMPCIFEVLINKKQIPKKRKDILYSAIKSDMATSVSMLLQNCPQEVLDYKDPNTGDTPLLLAVRLMPMPRIVNILMAGARITEINSVNGDSALHVAIMNDKMEIARLILSKPEAKSLINMKNKESLTPLHLACEKAATAIIFVFAEELVSRHGADVNICTDKGEYPYDCIEKHMRSSNWNSKLCPSPPAALKPTCEEYQKRDHDNFFEPGKKKQKSSSKSSSSKTPKSSCKRT